MRQPRDRKASAAPETTAYEKGLRLLARREHSARELKTKLAARGHTATDAKDAIDDLAGRAHQSDARFGESLARSRARQGYGRRRIEAELKSHALTAPAIRAAIEACDVDWTASAATQLRKRFGGIAAADPVERARRAQFLLRRGFDPATVRAVTRAEVDDPGEEFD